MTGSRERKRAERRKRKRRSAERVTTAGADVPTAEENDGTAEENGGTAARPEEGFAERMARRSEERNAAARARLEPLDRGERPTAVTVGAIISVVFAAIFTASAGLSAIGSVEVDGETPPALGIALLAVALWTMAWGMWRARYWAVLGFQALLLLTLATSALSLVVFTSVFELIFALLLLGGSGTLFYFLIRAMARIQMPRSSGAE